MKKFILLLVVLAVVVVIVGLGGLLFYVTGYNSAVAKEQAVKEAWGNVDAQLKRRFDLIPNLVSTVKGYAAHEKGIFEELANTRKAYFAAQGRPAQMQAASRIEGVLSRLLMLQENYPDLKASENFLSLQDQLEGTENRIAVARTRYNEAVKDLNTFAKSFFGRYFVKWAGVSQADYFEAPKSETETVPAVDFTG
ncbi:MAG: LemA family protein [Planctomycetes bacterium]|nr:LemA family protein [Planctomycetota bacterium]